MEDGVAADREAATEAGTEAEPGRNEPGRKRRGRLGLRARATVAAGLGALAATTVLSLVTYGVVRAYLVSQRDLIASRQTYTNARVVRDVLRTPQPQVGELLAGLRTDAGSFPLVRYRNRWFATAVGSSEEILPRSLLGAIEEGRSARQRFDLNGTPHQAVGVVMPSAEAAYVEVFPLGSLQRTLAVVRNSLLGGTAAATLGAAALGYWSSRRVLQPVARVADAAEALAEGGLDTRLDAEHDPDLRRLVDSFNEMADAIQARIEREVRFASDVSHELRTPLAALTGAADVLNRRRDQLDPRSRQALDILTNQLRRFSSLVLDLLEMSRIDSGVVDLHPEPVAIAGLVRKVAANSNAPDLDVESGPGMDDAVAVVDKRRFERLLFNLLENAERYGGGPVRIRVDGADGTVRVHVDDAGPGVPSGERQRIFERFSRGSTTQGVPGTGLGLALVAEHAHLMRGSASVGDSPEGGARFTLTLPRSEER